MKYEYQHNESNIRGYEGITFDKNESNVILNNEVKSKLIDRPQRDDMLKILETLKQDTGFEKSETLLVDIQTLLNENVDVQDFRIGEALAEVVLEENFNCRFYWNELRDARNPKGNKTGADLVGFIEIGNEILFLFGEVKTSSEQKSPPQVMTNPDGIENQLKDLYNDQQKRLILISYIKSKIDLVDSEGFKQDFNNAIKNYYISNSTNYLLYGVLVRDTNPDENDIKKSYEKLKIEILKPTGLKLLAIYLPITKEKWLSIINGVENEAN
ncbi:MAG: hypothetical protein WHS65_09340 [Melioribacteraceae bacterium]